MEWPARGERVAGRGPLTHVSGVTGRGPPARPIRQLWEAPVFTERTSVGPVLRAHPVVACRAGRAGGGGLTRQVRPGSGFTVSCGPQGSDARSPRRVSCNGRPV